MSSFQNQNTKLADDAISLRQELNVMQSTTDQHVADVKELRQALLTAMTADSAQNGQINNCNNQLCRNVRRHNVQSNKRNVCNRREQCVG